MEVEPTVPKSLSRRQEILVTAAVVLSGSAALVYEVVWSRQLSVFLGITIRAEAVVLAAFMLGLALGNRVLGRRADRTRRPLLLFAGLEAAIGIYGLISTMLLPRLAPFYARFADPNDLTTPAGDITRFLIAAAALLIPTVLMGGTIPALVRGSIRSIPSIRIGRSAKPADTSESPSESHSATSLGFVIGRVYALNTLGAALGAFAAGFVLLPRLGTTNTLVVAAVINLGIALALWAGIGGFPGFGGSRKPGAPEAAELDAPKALPEPGSGLSLGTAFAAFAVFGAAALAVQLGWIQSLTQILGSSVYAFSLTLSGYLAGLSIGGFAFAAWTRRRPRNHASAGSDNRTQKRGPWIAGAAAASVTLGLLVFDRLPGLFLQAFRWNLETHLGLLVGFSFLIVWCLVLVPTALFGFLSALITSACSPRSRTAGEDVGAAYAANTAGTTLGALAAGFWLLPNVGLQTTLLLGAVGLAACGSLLFMARRPRPSWATAKATAALLLFAFLAALTPRWDEALITSGPFINASRILDLPAGSDFREALRKRNRIVYYRESAIGTVSVRDVVDDRLLVINGKTDGSRSGDRRTQLALGHLPALLHSSPEQVLVVGFGTGMTLAAVSAHPEVKRLDVIEISPEVVEASRFFAAENRGVLFDPRLRLRYADARSFLLASRNTWDVIISEPSNPWISGVANLFTREYFELARQRLAPGGLIGQWFQSYGMSGDDLRSVIGTFAGVFKHVTIWTPQPGDLILIGSDEAHALDSARTERLAGSPGGGADMSAADWSGIEDFVRMLLLDSNAASTFGAGAPANTDEHPRVEFNAPRNMYRETTFTNLLELVEHARTPSDDRPAKTVAPIRDHRTNSGTGFGLKATGGANLIPEQRVHWVALRPTKPAALPTLGVSLRRVAVHLLPKRAAVEGVATGRSRELSTEIEVLSETEPLDRQRLEERIASLSARPIADWQSGALADTTPTLRGILGNPVEVGIAWACPRSEPPFESYFATVSSNLVVEFEGSLACSN